VLEIDGYILKSKLAKGIVGLSIILWHISDKVYLSLSTIKPKQTFLHHVVGCLIGNISDYIGTIYEYLSQTYFFQKSSSSNIPPPPLPARPATASGALGAMGTSHTIAKIDGSSPKLPGSADSINRIHHVRPYTNQQQHIARQRVHGLNASATSIPENSKHY